jgi:hypothetical protein
MSSLSDAIYVPIWVALVVAVPQILGVIMQFFTHLRINTLEKNTNSIKDELVKVVGESEHAKGLLEGRDIIATSPVISLNQEK